MLRKQKMTIPTAPSPRRFLLSARAYVQNKTSQRWLPMNSMTSVDGYLLPTIAALKRKLTSLRGLEYCEPLKTAVIAGLEKRFGDRMRDTPLVVSAVLLPLFKMQWIAEAQQGMITQLMKDEVARLPQNVEPSTQASPESAETSAEDFFGFEDFGCGEQGERCGASQELARYLSDTAGKEVTDILNYPSLHQLFLRYNLAVP
ncbi:unnamed protein product, partial [Ixodes pacificus]